jgi:ribosomal protein S16
MASVDGANPPKRPVRIAGASGGFTDRQRSILSFARDNDVDVIIGDWMSEMTMQWHGVAKADAARAGQDTNAIGAFDPSFMGTFSSALSHLQQRRIKVAVNAGASEPDKLAALVIKAVEEQGLDLKVAWIQGDEVMDVVQTLLKEGEKFENICFGGNLEDWPFEPIAAQCYLGGAGIAESFRAGADIVICGRVSDAAPVIGAAMWWHGWDRNHDFDALAGSLIAGHLIECSSYVCGGYYSGFKALFDGCENIGFPIAAIKKDGTFVLEKEPNTGGEMSVGTATSQLLYEIQGPRYYGSDVVALLEGIQMQQIAKDQVLVTGVKGSPPPTTTKVGITARGGYQAEFHYYMCGLDLKEKAEWTERQIRYSMGKNVEKFSCLKFSLNGWCQEDPENQDVATVDFRIFVQTKDKNILGAGSMVGFQRWCMENFLQSVPGASIENDLRQTSGKEYFEYWAALLPQSKVSHIVNLPFLHDKTISIPSSASLENYGKTYETRQWSYDTRNPVDLASVGPTKRGPLGWVALGRSGDKASDANVGFFVRNNDEWYWLRSLLTVAKMKELLGPEYNGKDIDRFEIPALRAVHFLLHDHLDRGWSATSTYDGLGKNVCEYLRAKHVDIPIAFLERGTVSHQRRFQE